MKPAGLEASKGVISVNYGKDPLDPTWKDDAGMKKYFEFMAKYYPDGDKDSSFNSYGYSTSQLMIYVLQKCGDNLTRENVMKQATSLKNVQLDLSLPGIVANTTPDDYRVNKQLQMMKFNGERWELFGPILEDVRPGSASTDLARTKRSAAPSGPPIFLPVGPPPGRQEPRHRRSS